MTGSVATADAKDSRLAGGCDKRCRGRAAVDGSGLSTSKVKSAELIVFVTQLSVMLDSGVVLSEALDAIEEQLEPGIFKAVVFDIAGLVKSGENLSKSLAGYPRIFSPMFISMVRASEASGRMAEMLGVLGEYLDFEVQTRKRIKNALTYPAIMAAVALVATAIMILFVLPRFTKIYAAREVTLPALTRLLVGFSNALCNFEVMTFILTAIVLAGTAFYYWASSAAGKRLLDFLKIRIPVLGTMFVDLVITRSMRIMATMVNTGVSLLDTIEVIKGLVNNYHFERLWEQVDKKIRDGYQLSDSISLSQGGDLVAPGIIQMLRAGEKSGRLGEVSDKISIFYEKKLQSSIKSVMALIEPLMIVLIGGIIGTIAIALLLPVFRISTIIAQ